MTRFREPDISAYDILGVSPDSSAKEIDSAFHQLIDEGGYREGVPLKKQWQRAREIKAAYATLGDPAKRAVYDESHKGVSERLLWPAVVADPAADSLVRPAGKPGSPAVKAVEPPAADAPEAERLPADTVEQRGGITPSAPDRPVSLEFSPTPDSTRRIPVKETGIAAAAAFAAGALLYFTWAGGDRQPDGAETAPQLAAQVERAALGAGGPAQLAQTSADADGGTAPAEEQAGISADPVPPDTPFVVVPGPVASDPAAPEAPELVVAEMQPQPGGTAAVGGEASAPAAPAAPATPVAARGSGVATAEPAAGRGPAAATAARSATVAAAPAPAQHPVGPTPSATAMAARSVAVPVARPPVAIRPAANVIRTPAQWLSGGPTNADNRRGRYKGTVVVQFTVRPDGRVANCVPARAGGDVRLTAMTCRLIEERTRFRPALDAFGRPIASPAHATYQWGSRRRPLSSKLSKLFSWL